MLLLKSIHVYTYSIYKHPKITTITLLIVYIVLHAHSTVSDIVTLWTVVRHAPLSMEFSRQKYQNGQPFPFPCDLPDPRIKPGSPAPAFFTVYIGKPIYIHTHTRDKLCIQYPTTYCMKDGKIYDLGCSSKNIHGQNTDFKL